MLQGTRQESPTRWRISRLGLAKREAFGSIWFHFHILRDILYFPIYFPIEMAHIYIFYILCNCYKYLDKVGAKVYILFMWIEKTLNNLVDYWMFFPLVLAEKSKSKFVKTIAFLFFLIWVFPAMLLMMPVFTPLLLMYAFYDFVFTSM